MLAEKNHDAVEPSSESSPSGQFAIRQSRLAKAMHVEWLGQMAASVCWIASVFCYGVSSSGDFLQLCAASAWLLANIATIMTDETEPFRSAASSD